MPAQRTSGGPPCCSFYHHTVWHNSPSIAAYFSAGHEAPVKLKSLVFTNSSIRWTASRWRWTPTVSHHFRWSLAWHLSLLPNLSLCTPNRASCIQRGSYKVPLGPANPTRPQTFCLMGVFIWGISLHPDLILLI